MASDDRSVGSRIDLESLLKFWLAICQMPGNHNPSLTPLVADGDNGSLPTAPAISRFESCLP